MTFFNDIHALLEAVELDDVVVHEERARRIRWEGTVTEDLPEPTISMGFQAEGNQLRYRFKLVLADAEAEYVADYEAVYAAQEDSDLTLDDSLRLEFAQRVAFMAVYPYLRVSVFNGAGRLGTPRPVLGMVRAGQFSAGEQMSEEDVRNAFFDNRSELAAD